MHRFTFNSNPLYVSKQHVSVTHLCLVWTDAWTAGLWRRVRAADPPVPVWRSLVRLPSGRFRCDDNRRRCMASSGHVHSSIPKPPPEPCSETSIRLPAKPEPQSRVEPFDSTPNQQQTEWISSQYMQGKNVQQNVPIENTLWRFKTLDFA